MTFPGSTTSWRIEARSRSQVHLHFLFAITIPLRPFRISSRGCSPLDLFKRANLPNDSKCRSVPSFPPPFSRCPIPLLAVLNHQCSAPPLSRSISFSSSRLSSACIWRACTRWNTNAVSVGGTRAHRSRGWIVGPRGNPARTSCPPSLWTFPIPSSSRHGRFASWLEKVAVDILSLSKFLHCSVRHRYFSRSPVVDSSLSLSLCLSCYLDIRWTSNQPVGIRLLVPRRFLFSSFFQFYFYTYIYICI